jgi:hypothetical protein
MGFRQRLFPREFRIAPLPPAKEIEDFIEALREASRSAPSPEKGDPGQLKLLADIGTGLWRLKQKMVRPGTDHPLDEMKRAYRHLESVWDAMAQAGTEIQDHTDRPFDPGQAIKVIAYQPTPGLSREKVIETVKPTIYHKGRIIQMGEVIVGQPQKEPPVPDAEKA